MSFERVLILGCGYTGLYIARLAQSRGLAVTGSVRAPERVATLERAGVRVLQSSVLGAEIKPYIDGQTRVVVAFPADLESDQRIAPWLRSAHSVVYISSTGVYGGLRGRVDETTPLPAAEDARVARLQAAEREYLQVGALVLRCPGIYGPDRGLHVRMLRGEHRIPGDGSQWLSRIHAQDLALATLCPVDVRGEALLMGDLEPAPQIEVVRFVCERYGVPMPASAPLESLHATLRADRAVDARSTLSRLQVELRYPSYRQGMAPEATGMDPAAARAGRDV